MDIEIGDILALAGPLVMIAVGVMLFVLSLRREHPRAAARRRLSWLLVGAGAAMLLLVLTHTRGGSPQLQALRNLEARHVATLTLGGYPITGELSRTEIVEALRRTRSYTPKSQGYVDDVLLEIGPDSGVAIVVGVAESLGEAGAVLIFYTDEPDESRAAVAYGFSATLPDVLRRAGFALPTMRLRRQMDEIPPSEVSVIRVGDKTLTRPADVAAILQSLKNARTQYARDPRRFQQPVTITVFRSSGQELQIEAARLASGEGAAFWGLYRCPNGIMLTHGHSLSYTLAGVLDSAGTPLPSRKE